MQVTSTIVDSVMNSENCTTEGHKGLFTTALKNKPLLPAQEHIQTTVLQTKFNEFNFYSYRCVTVKCSLSLGSTPLNICLDTECSVTLINQDYL